METQKNSSCYTTTSDGVALHYIERGAGQAMVLLHGWSQSAEMFRCQIDEFSHDYRVIALDMRGHGQSDKPGFGYRISRLAKDLHDVFTTLHLNEVILLGHSMGSSVMWSYWDLFGPERLSKLIFVDQQVCMVRNPLWTEAESQEFGGTQSLAALVERVNGLAGPAGAAFRKAFIAERFTPHINEELLHWVMEQNAYCPRPHAATLLFNHAMQDWRDVIPRITLPSLIVTGRASNKPLPSQEWICRHIPGAHLEVFEEDEGGEHFMFLENPDKFNRCVKRFCASI